MRNLTQTNYIPEKRTAVALGLFDGVHIGHQDVIRHTCQYAGFGYASAVFTFKTDTITSKGHDGRVEMLLSDAAKWRKFDTLGVEYLFTPEFSILRNMPPEDFVRTILRYRLNAAVAVCGEDFRFGRGALGNSESLKVLGKKFGIKVEIVPPTLFLGAPVSSTRIRTAVRDGDMKTANAMLGYPFTLTLPVLHGQELGRTLDFPTINQKIPKGQVLPRFGVYASLVQINGGVFRGVTNIGLKPTVCEQNYTPTVETYIIGFEGDLYGKTIPVELLKFLRPETRFASIAELKDAIAKDIETALSL